MNNSASILVLIFLAITFIQSAYEKLFGWQETITWLQSHFAKTFLRDYIRPSLGLLLVLELVTGILCLVGCVELMVINGKTFGHYGSIFSCITLIIMLVGQRLVKDYDGARTIAIYFILSILAVWWMS
jgi:uncharacterized membrane protein YphA (DoxX/SURF4 family)